MEQLSSGRRLRRRRSDHVQMYPVDVGEISERGAFRGEISERRERPAELTERRNERPGWRVSAGVVTTAVCHGFPRQSRTTSGVAPGELVGDRPRKRGGRSVAVTVAVLESSPLSGDGRRLVERDAADLAEPLKLGGFDHLSLDDPEDNLDLIPPGGTPTRNRADPVGRMRGRSRTVVEAVGRLARPKRRWRVGSAFYDEWS